MLTDKIIPQDELKAKYVSVYSAEMIKPALSPFFETANADVWATMQTIYNVFVNVGMILVAFYLIVNLIEKRVQGREFNFINDFTLPFFSFLFAYILLTNGFTLLKSLFEFGGGITKSFTEMDGLDDKATQLGEQVWRGVLAKYGNGQGHKIRLTMRIVLLFQYLLINAIVFIPRVSVAFICLYQVLRLLLKTTFAPLALADTMTFSRFSENNAVKFLRGYIADMLTGGVYAMIIIMSNALATGAVRKYVLLAADDASKFSLVEVSFMYGGFLAVMVIVMAMIKPFLQRVITG